MVNFNFQRLILLSQHHVLYHVMMDLLLGQLILDGTVSLEMFKFMGI